MAKQLGVLKAAQNAPKLWPPKSSLKIMLPTFWDNLYILHEIQAISFHFQA